MELYKDVKRFFYGQILVDEETEAIKYRSKVQQIVCQFIIIFCAILRLLMLDQK